MFVCSISFINHPYIILFQNHTFNIVLWYLYLTMLSKYFDCGSKRLRSVKILISSITKNISLSYWRSYCTTDGHSKCDCYNHKKKLAKIFLSVALEIWKSPWFCRDYYQIAIYFVSLSCVSISGCNWETTRSLVRLRWCSNYLFPNRATFPR